MTRPFLKWAGGKYKLTEKIKSLLPSPTDVTTLVEPFAGACSLMLNTDYENYVIADLNIDLINLYEIIKQKGLGFIATCGSYFNNKLNNDVEYYKLRNIFNQTTNVEEKSAIFLYLNRHCFNGLCRYNQKGGFNVPFGKYKEPYFPSKELINFYEKVNSRNTKFICCDFTETFEKHIPNNSVIYADPPYSPLSVTSNFTTYLGDGFGSVQQEKLVELSLLSASKNVPVLISNHSTNYTKHIYSNASSITEFEVSRSIAATGDKRVKVKELMVLYK